MVEKKQSVSVLNSHVQEWFKMLQYAWPELRIQSYAALEMKKHFESD